MAVEQVLGVVFLDAERPCPVSRFSPPILLISRIRFFLQSVSSNVIV